MGKSLQDKLFNNGIVVITSSINSDTSEQIIMELLNIKAKDPKKEIQLYISSHTYNYLDIFAIHDVLVSLPNPISTFVIGEVGGLSPLLVSLGNKGKRYCLKNSVIYLSEVRGIMSGGQQTEIDIAAKEALNTRETYERLMSKYTGQSIDNLHKALVEERKLTAEDAVKFGLIDEVLQ